MNSLPPEASPISLQAQALVDALKPIIPDLPDVPTDHDADVFLVHFNGSDIRAIQNAYQSLVETIAVQ